LTHSTVSPVHKQAQAHKPQAAMPAQSRRRARGGQRTLGNVPALLIRSHQLSMSVIYGRRRNGRHAANK